MTRVGLVALPISTNYREPQGLPVLIAFTLCLFQPVLFRFRLELRF
jgi:hypothetical protein